MSWTGSDYNWQSPGAWNLISTITASGSPSYITFNSNIDSTYDTYVFVATNLKTTTGNEIHVQYYDSTDNSWYYTSGNEQGYRTTQQLVANGETNMYYPGNTANSSTLAYIGYAANVPFKSDTTVNFVYYLSGPSSSSKTMGWGQAAYETGATVNVISNFTHTYYQARATTGIRFHPYQYSSSGNSTGATWSSGTIRMYGIKNS